MRQAELSSMVTAPALTAAGVGRFWRLGGGQAQPLDGEAPLQRDLEELLPDEAGGADYGYVVGLGHPLFTPRIGVAAVITRLRPDHISRLGAGTATVCTRVCGCHQCFCTSSQ